MLTQSIPEIWSKVEASVTISLVNNGDDGHILVRVDPGYLTELEVIGLAFQALSNRLCEVLTPSPGPRCSACQVPAVKRSSPDGAYAIWLCPDCHKLISLD